MAQSQPTRLQTQITHLCVQEIDLGYEHGADRLVLRFPQLVTHTITADSPLARYAGANARGGASGHPAAEVVVIVEGVAFSSSATMARTMTFTLPESLQRDRYFAPVVSTGSGESSVPIIDWSAFHETVPLGQAYKRSLSMTHSTDLGAGQGGRLSLQGALEADTPAGGLQAQEVELSATDGGR